MMTTCRFYLFGPPRLVCNGVPIAINLRKALALLTYLAVNRQPVTRDALTTLLWPDKETRTGRANLRRTLYDLSHLLETTAGLRLLTVSEEKVLLAQPAALWTDIATFQQQVAQLVSANTTPTEPNLVAALAATADLYTDDFLAGFTLPDAPAFDDWQFFQREALRQHYSALLATLVAGYEAQHNYEQAIHYARRWSALDRLDEKVHRRLMTIHAQAGQIAAAVRQYDDCVAILQQELDAPPGAETTALFDAIRMRRIPLSNPLPTDIFVAPTMPVVTPVTPSEKLTRAIPIASNPPHNLPMPVTPFIGREQEVAELFARLVEPACQLLTLVGPGGIGKTRLAIEVATRLANRDPVVASLPFADGIFLVELQAVQRISDVIAAIATAIGFRFYSAVPVPEQLIRFLSGKQMLLILDNFEQLLDDSESIAAWVSALLVAAPKLTLLVTAREALNLREEWFHPLGGMGLPPSGRRFAAALRVPPETDLLADAVQLFALHARRARPDFDLATERQAVTYICRLVDGVPLALELAAAWLKVLPCRQIAAEIEQNLDILTARHQNFPARHRSMRAVVEQSWQLLESAEQQALMRLTVFRNGFTQAAGTEVAGASLLILATLADKALVQMTQDPGARTRCQLHALLRQFALERLTDTPEDATPTRARHSLYYLALLQQQAPRLLGKEQQQAVQTIGAELDNIRAALTWAIQAGDAVMLLASLDPLYSFYQIQSRYLEGKELFVAALAGWRALGQPLDAAAQQVQIQLVARCGALSYLLCEYSAAEIYLQEALPLAESQAGNHELVFILNFLGRLTTWQGEKQQAQSYLTRSLQLSQALDDHNRTASALEKLANLIHATFGEYRESKALALESLGLSRKLGRPDRIAYALDTLGFVTFCLGEYSEAESYYAESLRIFETSGDQYGQAMALGGLALVYWALGGAHLVDATTYFQQSLLICRELGHDGQVAGRLAGLARVANDQRDYAQAQQFATEGLTLARKLGSPVYLSHVLYCLGETAYKVGDLPAARIYLLEALQMTSATGLMAYLAIALFHYAVLLIEESKGEVAGETPQQVDAIALLTLVQNHPATWQIYKVRVAERFTTLSARLSSQVNSAVQPQRFYTTLHDAVTEILRVTEKK